MRDIPNEMAARIESGAATLCHVWRLERADGVVLGFTDHDRDLVVDGVVCRAASGWTAGVGESAVGLAAGSISAAGVLDVAAITEADVAAGLFDAATVELWRIDWVRPDLKVRLWAGALVRITREGDGFVAELEGPLAKLERVVGRTYGRMCARLGDQRCKVAETAGRVCDKRWETCVGTFENGSNFRGFPDVPGDDFLTAYPAGSAQNDGGEPAVRSGAITVSPSPERGGRSSRRRDRVGRAEQSESGRRAAPTPSLRDEPPPRGEGEGCAIVAAARSWLGTPYRHQASIKGVGADCLGLVRGVWREVAGEEPKVLPAYSADWAEVGGRETLLEAAGRWMRPVAVVEMRAGDVLLFRMSPGAAVKHCAILSDFGESEPRMIHAYWGRAVVESWMGVWWRRRLVAVFRFPEEV